MALKLTRKMPPMEGVNTGETATLQLPIGFTYHTLLIDAANLTASEIVRVSVKANGEAIATYKGGEELDEENQYDQRAPFSDDGILVFDFERPKLMTRQARELTVVGTGLPQGEGDGKDPRKIRTLELEVEIASSTASASAPKISVRAIVTPASPSGLLKKVNRFTYNPTSTGEFEIPDLPRQGDVNRMIFREDNVAIDRVRIERDQTVAFDRRSKDNERVQGDSLIRKPMANMWVVDFTEDGYGGDMLGVNPQKVQDWRNILDLSTAGTMPVLVEYVQALQNY